VTKVIGQHNSGQFSDSKPEHVHDANSVFGHAVDIGAWWVSGTESGASPVNHDARDAIQTVGQAHDFFVFDHKYGEWVALNRRFLHHFDHGFDGPYIPGTHGLSVAEGAHAPRGTAWASGEAKDGTTGRITVGSQHWLTQRSIKGGGIDNSRMVKGSQAFGKAHGKGGHLVFLDGDANEHDDARDIFEGGDFLTIADELKKHPKTHGVNTQRGSDIDFIASWKGDTRVTAEDYVVLDDSDLRLFFDHFLLVGTFKVTPLHAA